MVLEKYVGASFYCTAAIFTMIYCLLNTGGIQEMCFPLYGAKFWACRLDRKSHNQVIDGNTQGSRKPC